MGYNLKELKRKAADAGIKLKDVKTVIENIDVETLVEAKAIREIIGLKCEKGGCKKPAAYEISYSVEETGDLQRLKYSCEHHLNDMLKNAARLAKLATLKQHFPTEEEDELVLGRNVKLDYVTVLQYTNALMGNAEISDESKYTLLDNLQRHLEIWRERLDSLNKSEQGAESTADAAEHDLRDKAWKELKAELGNEPWTLGEEVDFKGFFNYGWSYRGRYQ